MKNETEKVNICKICNREIIECDGCADGIDIKIDMAWCDGRDKHYCSAECLAEAYDFAEIEVKDNE